MPDEQHSRSEQAPTAAKGKLSSCTIQILLAEYEHCASDIRNFDQIFYQVPAISGVAVYGLAYVTHEYGSSALLKNLLWLVWLLGAFLFLSLSLGMRKHYFFQNSRVEDIGGIIKRLESESNVEMYKICISTRDVLRRHGDKDWAKGRIVKWKAFWALYWSMLGITGLSFVVALYFIAKSLRCI